MSTLRVLLAAAPSPARADAWALFDDAGRCVRSGHDVPAQWPAATAREAVLAASAVRFVALTLPPMSADRIAAAVAYALEDRLAGPAQEHQLVSGPQASNGVVLVTVAPRSLTVALREQFARIVAEPASTPLPPAGRWHWHASAGGGGFLRKPDGSAFAVSTPASGDVPPEIALALAEAAHLRATPRSIVVTFDASAAQRAAWSAACGVPVESGVPWRWDAAGTALAEAPNLAPRPAPTAATASTPVGQTLRRAAFVAMAALALHALATTVQWTWLRVDAWRAERALVALAQSAGAGENADAEAGAAALARKFADARHRAGLAAPADALPLLARAAPALASLPAQALRTATFAPDSWTFDIQKLDAASLATLDQAMGAAGLSTIRATTASGARMRVGLAPGMDRP
jgi:hypothetical protein